MKGVKGEYLKAMGDKVKALRKERKLSLPQLSQRTGMGLNTLWFIENGRRNPHLLSLKAIADVFEVDVKDFL
jgi:transcriptional regulator with XRE-family HTH domain